MTFPTTETREDQNLPVWRSRTGREFERRCRDIPYFQLTEDQKIQFQKARAWRYPDCRAAQEALDQMYYNKSNPFLLKFEGNCGWGISRREFLQVCQFYGLCPNRVFRPGIPEDILELKAENILQDPGLEPYARELVAKAHQDPEIQENLAQNPKNLSPEDELDQAFSRRPVREGTRISRKLRTPCLRERTRSHAEGSVHWDVHETWECLTKERFWQKYQRDRRTEDQRPTPELPWLVQNLEEFCAVRFLVGTKETFAKIPQGKKELAGILVQDPEILQEIPALVLLNPEILKHGIECNLVKARFLGAMSWDPNLSLALPREPSVLPGSEKWQETQENTGFLDPWNPVAIKYAEKFARALLLSHRDNLELDEEITLERLSWESPVTALEIYSLAERFQVPALEIAIALVEQGHLPQKGFPGFFQNRFLRPEFIPDRTGILAARAVEAGKIPLARARELVPEGFRNSLQEMRFQAA